MFRRIEPLSAALAALLYRRRVAIDVSPSGYGQENPSAVREIDRWEGGFGWIAHPEEAMGRASHGLVTGDGVWLLDPVDYDGLDERLREEGGLAGVCVLLDRHVRDSASIARRHDVAVQVPGWMEGMDTAVDGPVEHLDDSLGEYDVRRVIDNPLWQEAALYDGATLYTPEILGTVAYFCAPGERVGVHPVLRLVPPRGIADLAVDRLLVGHGEGVFDDAGRAIADALETARRRAPRVYLEILGSIVS